MIATGMGWDINTPRPSDAQVCEAFPETVEALRGATCVRPSDVPLWAGTAENDDTERVRCALLIARVLRAPVHIDREYRYSGVLELQENQIIYGNGPHAPGLRMNPKPWFDAPDFSWPKSGVAAIVHAPGVKRFTVRDLQIDGGQQDVDWQAVATGPNAAKFSQWLRESPSWAGLAPTTQDGRSPCEEITLENVHIHDCPGTCLFGMAMMRCRNLTLGNSVSGRILYRFRGECTGLHTYGYSRSSVARINAPATIVGWTYRGGGYVNPWPENEQPGAICAIERLTSSPGMVALENIDWDGKDSVFAGTVALRANEHCRVTGCLRGLRSFDSSPVQLGSYTVDLDLRTTDSAPPNLFAGQLANVRDARIKWVNTDTRDKSAIDWSYTGTAYAVWSRLLHNAVQVSVARKPHHPPDHEQRIELHVDNPWPTNLVLHLPDLCVFENGAWRMRRADEVVPTTVRLTGRIDNRIAAWIGTQPGWSQGYVPTAAELEALPVRVIIDGLRCNTIAPGPFVGDQPWTIHAGMIEVR